MTRSADLETEGIEPGVAGQAPPPKELSRAKVRYCRDMKIDHKSTSAYSLVEQGIDDDSRASRAVEETSVLRDNAMLRLDYGHGADDWASQTRDVIDNLGQGHVELRDRNGN